LRAPLLPQLARTDALIVIGPGHASDAVVSELAASGKPVLAARQRPEPDTVAALSGKPVLAFAGIGDPARFFRTLRASGIDVRRERVFADHHPFDRAEIEALVAEAARDRLTLVTTEKDLVRLRMPAELASLAPRIVPFPVTLAFDDTAALRSLLANRLFAARQRQFQRTA
jgi:tetraacyldisaccharide 4'-kinase